MSPPNDTSGGDGGESGRENEPPNDKSQPPNETQNDFEEQTLIVNDGENTHKASQRRFNWEKSAGHHRKGTSAIHRLFPNIQLETNGTLVPWKGAQNECTAKTG